MQQHWQLQQFVIIALHELILIILYLELKRLRDDATKKNTDNDVVASIISDGGCGICFV